MQLRTKTSSATQLVAGIAHCSKKPHFIFLLVGRPNVSSIECLQWDYWKGRQKGRIEQLLYLRPKFILWRSTTFISGAAEGTPGRRKRQCRENQDYCRQSGQWSRCHI